MKQPVQGIAVGVADTISGWEILQPTLNSEAAGRLPEVPK